MDEKRTALLRTHRQNIERCQSLLKTKLSEVEVHYLEKRLSEERFAISMLDFMALTSKGDGLRARRESVPTSAVEGGAEVARAEGDFWF